MGRTTGRAWATPRPGATGHATAPFDRERLAAAAKNQKREWAPPRRPRKGIADGQGRLLSADRCVQKCYFLAEKVHPARMRSWGLGGDHPAATVFPGTPFGTAGRSARYRIEARARRLHCPLPLTVHAAPAFFPCPVAPREGDGGHANVAIRTTANSLLEAIAAACRHSLRRVRSRGFSHGVSKCVVFLDVRPRAPRQAWRAEASYTAMRGWTASHAARARQLPSGTDTSLEACREADGLSRT